MNLEMRHISKTFSAVRALDDVHFSVSPSSIHGLLGENGAGKTTLMNILAGTFSPDSGSIIIDGKEITHMTPSKAMQLKIRFIHQELNLCNDLKVYENMFLGNELYTKIHTVDKKEEIARAEKVLKDMHADIPAQALVDDLETAEKQLVEIARALLFQSELIIMDEPTTALNNEEIENLFHIMRNLKQQGVSFIYISHKMPELFAICDRYTVLRDGKYIQSGFFSDIDEKQATQLLIGGCFTSSDLYKNENKRIGEKTVLSVRNINSDNYSDISFDVRAGEICVITGLQGSGAADLALALFGAQSIKSGNVLLKDKEIKNKHINDVMKTGLAMVPRNRKERGIVPDLSILDNLSLAYFVAKDTGLFVSVKEKIKRFVQYKKQMAIKSDSPALPITSLSGGNQQKVIVAKWLAIDADVYLMDNPTQGIDIGAKFEIYKLIYDIARQGKAVIVFTNEYPEIRQLADTVLVLYKGRISGMLNRDNLSESTVMALSTGISQIM